MKLKTFLLSTATVALMAAGSTPSTPPAAPVDPCPAAAASTTSSPAGYFTASGNQILSPSGQAVKLHGINVYWAIIGQVIADQTAKPLTTSFPGIEIMRINVFAADLTSANVAALQVYIATLTANKVIAEIEYHEYPGILTGSDLNRVAQWYSTIAAATRGNPFVIFGTQNEPSQGGSVSDINTEIHTIYSAIRDAGNNTLILVDPYGAYNTQGIDLSGLTNVAWDLHYYAWLPQSGTNLASEVAQAQRTANIPVLVGEYGPAAGDGVDAGGAQVVTEVQASPQGSMAWAWETYNPGDPGPGDLVMPPYNGSAGLTDFGQTTAGFIAGSGSTNTGTYTPDAFVQPLCQLSQTLFPTAQTSAQTAASTTAGVAAQQTTIDQLNEQIATMQVSVAKPPAVASSDAADLATVQAELVVVQQQISALQTEIDGQVPATPAPVSIPAPVVAATPTLPFLTPTGGSSFSTGSQGSEGGEDSGE